MKRTLALFLILMLLGTSALAQEAWTGAVLVGNLPKDAELVQNDVSEQGYTQMLLYDAITAIVLARFESMDALNAYVQEAFPPREYGFVEEACIIAGYEGSCQHYLTGNNEDTRTVYSYAFETPSDTFLFLVSNPIDWELDEEELSIWLDSLDVFEP